jgi:hypothetical protein
LKKYPFSLQHTFFDPSKLASLKIHKLALRAQPCEFSTLRSPRWVPQKIYEFALRELLQSSQQVVQSLKGAAAKGTSLWATAAEWGNILRYFLSVLGLVLIIEGLPYFAFPDKFKKMISRLPEVPDNVLRFFGFIAMGIGLLFIYISRAGE